MQRIIAMYWMKSRLLLLQAFVAAVVPSASARVDRQVRCTGVVLDARSRAVADANVTLRWQTRAGLDTGECGSIRTDPCGRFSIIGSSPSLLGGVDEGYLVLIADKMGYAIDVADVQEGLYEDYTLQLGESVPLSGQVVDEAGSPVADVNVAFYRFRRMEHGFTLRCEREELREGALRVHTDTEGRFVFDRIPASSYLGLVAWKTGRATVAWSDGTMSKVSVQAGVGSDGIRIILPPEARVKGVVLDHATGRSVGGVLLVSGTLGYWPMHTTVSRPDGTFEMAGLAAGDMAICPRGPVHPTDWVGDAVLIHALTGQIKECVRVEVQKGGLLVVSVTEKGSGRPVAGAHLAIDYGGTTGADLFSGPEGKALVRLMPGVHKVVLHPKERYLEQGQSVDVNVCDGGAIEQAFQLQPFPVVRGRILDPNGVPASFAQVSLGAQNYDSVRSDFNGRFAVSYDPCDTESQAMQCLVMARDPAHGLAAIEPADPPDLPLDIRLRPGLTFLGKVVDPKGKGIPNARIVVMLRVGNWGSPIGSGQYAAKTDPHGQFEVAAIPADQMYSVSVSADGFGTKSADVVADRAVNNRLDLGTLELPLANLSVSGVVVDANDKPVSSARVKACGSSQPHRNTQADANGGFRIEKICAGPVEISAVVADGPARLSGYTGAQGGETSVKIVVGDSSTGDRSMSPAIPSLIGRSLPDLKDLGLTPTDANDKPLLVCFADIEQRPSRRCLSELTKKADFIAAKGVSVVVVQVSKVDLKQHEAWLKENKVSWQIHTVDGDFEARRLAWGVKSLPWLILTDKEHRVVAEGFAAGDLGKELAKLGLLLVADQQEQGLDLVSNRSLLRRDDRATGWSPDAVTIGFGRGIPSPWFGWYAVPRTRTVGGWPWARLACGRLTRRPA